MRISALAVLLALAATSAAAENVTVDDAAKHAGETATVVGRLSHVHKTASQTTFWDFDGTAPGSSFTAVIFKHDGGAFPDMTPMVGKTLAITGKIEIYSGKPEIVLKTIGQVQVAQ
ncbi:MAG TPA: hypothetical protein VNU97_20225 [Rhizomicrobium sp.]|jgi:hypothetical protein|nr:hypothetical protein [Rhizomicrobium sp.]